MSPPCFIIPAHILRAISESQENPEHVRQHASACLAACEQMRTRRHEHQTAPNQGQGNREAPLGAAPFIPSHVLSQLSESGVVDEEARSQAKQDLKHLESLVARKPAAPQAQLMTSGKGPRDTPYRTVYDAKHTMSESDLPGHLVRAEGGAKVRDQVVNEAYDNVGYVLEFYRKRYGWKSIDDKNADVLSSVHFGHRYENAFWFPEKNQMVFGDGGSFIGNFTDTIDVIGHEMTHAITERTSPLDYRGQSGALNEHVSDVFGIMIKQQLENETADKADWLIGEGCLLPGVKGVALRSMKNPGSAYNDPRFGSDPQVDNMSQYRDIYDDNGGVHIFSGIPNKAFYLASVAFGGYSWEKAGQIWWKAMNAGRLKKRATFVQFAEVTVDVAEDLFGKDAANTVRKAWADVGVIRKA